MEGRHQEFTRKYKKEELGVVSVGSDGAGDPRPGRKEDVMCSRRRSLPPVSLTEVCESESGEHAVTFSPAAVPVCSHARRLGGGGR